MTGKEYVKTKKRKTKLTLIFLPKTVHFPQLVRRYFQPPKETIHD